MAAPADDGEQDPVAAASSPAPQPSSPPLDSANRESSEPAPASEPVALSPPSAPTKQDDKDERLLQQGQPSASAYAIPSISLDRPTPVLSPPRSSSPSRVAKSRSPTRSAGQPTSSSAAATNSLSGYQWGTFIKRAVSTVEQSIDKVLDPALAEVTRSGQSDPVLVPPAQPTSSTTPTTNTTSTGRISMQQRLALAMQAQKASAAASATSRAPSSDRASAVSSSTRESLDADESDQRQSAERGRSLEIKDSNDAMEAVASSSSSINESAAPAAVVENRPSVEYAPNESPLRLELTQKQEELQNSLGRISILEEKVKYLSSQLLDYTHKNRQTGAIDKRLAEKDEKIGLLMQEGEQLSKNELRHMSLIKKLRLAERESERAVSDAQKRQERAEKEASELRDRLRKANEIERKQSERIRLLAKSDSEVDILKRERDSLKATISNLREELAHANLLAEDAISKVQSDALEKERARADGLQRELDEFKAEQAMERERFALEKFNLQSKMDREAERAKTREHELKEEISSLEHKLELERIHAEELSVSSSDDSHAKLARQIETLQSQYSIASENWQGIEAALLARISRLESERDELLKRETALRKKIQEDTTRARQLQEESDQNQTVIGDLEAELKLQVEVVKSLRSRIDEETERSAKAIRELEQDKMELERKLQEEEKLRREEATMYMTRSPPPLSPVISKRSGMGAMDSFPMFPTTSGGGGGNGGRVFNLSRESSFSEISGFGSLNGTAPSMISHRRMSRNVSMPAPNTSLPTSPAIGGITPTMSANASFASLNDAASSADLPQQINLHNALLSGDDSNNNSASGSVQGVDDMLSNASTAIGKSSSERMSSVIRRLASELASAKEELSIISRDRDQAREETVELLREIKQKRDVESECAELRTQLEELKVREQTTLEMLGEKTERVNELQDDVQDLKMMYRQQIQELIEKINEK
ncbi:TATA element modulatory factor 1 TATA binding-domain-containing protein [Myxozyma melibiosi]|uniref:TATA element modulatory factor 1 TATA binding-domain-containing protein n=1 Tax=Myxozyma melibiosi TaxID=54550 RepID=A0ABR1F753_9ASCO